MNPAVDDPESWECECLANMISACGAKCDDVAAATCSTCFNEHMCQSPQVCSSWKATACSEASLIAKKESGGSTGNDNANLLERATKETGECFSQGVAGEERSDAALDDTLAEKCET